MMRSTWAVVGVAAVAMLAGWVGPASAEPAGRDGQADIPATKVVLFSSGVGYFEHFGTVTGDAEAELMFKTEQINDVLKSMVVMDLDGGTVRRVDYGSREPLARALKSFGVDLSGMPTLAELLRQLRGAEVVVTAPEKITGKVLNVETRVKVVGQPPTQVTEEILDLVTAGGIQQLAVSDIQSFRLADERLDSELNKALSLLVASRDKDRKPVKILFTGKGKRHVRVGYIIETPVWKTSYRLELSGEKPWMQGWAIVDNTTDSDWSKVSLTLVSGRPISFIQDLYTPLYVPRPEVVPELYASLQPRMYDEGIEKADKLEALAAAGPMAPRPSGKMPYDQARRALGEKAAMLRPGTARGRYASRAKGGDISLRQGVQSLASAGKVGELFQYTISGPVNLARRRSAMLPVINSEITAEKVSIYNAQVLAKHPLNGVALTNDTKMKMLGGPVTVLDDGMYAGDARLDNLAPNEKRLLSYAVDLNVTVDPSASSTSTITAVKIVRGVLYVTRKHTYKQDYVIKNKAEEAKTLIVEHPYRSDRKLVAPAKFQEKTPSLYRFRVPVAKETTGKFTVLEQRTDTQTIAILTGSPGTFKWYTTSGEVSAGVKEALGKAIGLKNELVVLQRKLTNLQRQLNAITSGQARLRANLKVVGTDSQLGRRYLKTLNEQEDEIEKLGGQIKQARAQVEAKQKELEDYLHNLNVE